MKLAVALTLIQLHGPTGQPLYLNPAHISSVRQPIDTHQRHWPAGTHCVVVMSNGRFNAVAEDCVTVMMKLR